MYLCTGRTQNEKTIRPLGDKRADRLTSTVHRPERELFPAGRSRRTRGQNPLPRQLWPKSHGIESSAPHCSIVHRNSGKRCLGVRTFNHKRRCSVRAGISLPVAFSGSLDMRGDIRASPAERSACLRTAPQLLRELPIPTRFFCFSKPDVECKFSVVCNLVFLPVT